MEGLREEGVLHFLLRKKQIPAPYPINIRGVRKEKGSEEVERCFKFCAQNLAGTLFDQYKRF